MRLKDGSRAPDYTWGTGLQDAQEAVTYLSSWFDMSGVSGTTTYSCEHVTTTASDLEWLVCDSPPHLGGALPRRYVVDHCCSVDQACRTRQVSLKPVGDHLVVSPCRVAGDAVTVDLTAPLTIGGKPFEVICATEFLPAIAHYVTHLRNTDGSWITHDGPTAHVHNNSKTGHAAASVAGHSFLLRAVGRGPQTTHSIRSQALPHATLTKRFVHVIEDSPAPSQEEPTATSLRL